MSKRAEQASCGEWGRIWRTAAMEIEDWLLPGVEKVLTWLSRMAHEK